MISVYRIYFGRAWPDTGTEGRLRSLFDAVPEFLYSAATCERAEAVSEPDPQRRAAIRVAMTHAHVAVLLARDVPALQTWTEDEIAVARRGFRWRVPILGIAPDGGETVRGSVIRAADRVVRAHGPEVARAIQEIATAAQTERRSEIERLARRDVGSMEPPSIEALGEPPVRPLPFAEIAEAFHFLRASSGQRTG